MIDHRQQRNGHVRRMPTPFGFRRRNTLDAMRSDLGREFFPNTDAVELSTDVTDVRKD